MQTRYKNLLFAILSITIFISACKKDEEFPALAVDSTSLQFSYEEPNQKITISNTSDQTISWYTESKDSFITFSQKAGSFIEPAQLDLIIGIDFEKIPGEFSNTEVFITSNKGDRIKIDIIILDIAQSKQLLYYKVWDAVYDQTHNNVYILQYEDEAGFIDIYNVDQRVIEKRIEISYPLKYESSDLILNNSNTLIGIAGKDNFISISTNAEHTQKSYSVDLRDGETFLHFGAASFGHSDEVFLFPRYATTKNVDVIKVNLSTSEQNSFSLNFNGSISSVQLHPLDNFVYAVHKDHTPYYEHLLKIDLRDNQVELIYDEYEIGFIEELWINTKGDLLFGKEKAVATIDPTAPGMDILSRISFDEVLQHVSFNDFTNEILIIKDECENLPNSVYIYDELLNHQASVRLKDMQVPKETEPGYFYTKVKGQFAFAIESGNEVLVIEKAIQTDTYADLYSIDIYEID